MVGGEAARFNRPITCTASSKALTIKQDAERRAAGNPRQIMTDQSRIQGQQLRRLPRAAPRRVRCGNAYGFS